MTKRGREEQYNAVIVQEEIPKAHMLLKAKRKKEESIGFVCQRIVQM